MHTRKRARFLLRSPSPRFHLTRPENASVASREKTDRFENKEQRFAAASTTTTPNLSRPKNRKIRFSLLAQIRKLHLDGYRTLSTIR